MQHQVGFYQTHSYMSSFHMSWLGCAVMSMILINKGLF